MDNIYNRYAVSQPFQITAWRTLNEFRWEKNHSFAGESHNFWEVVCLLEGDAEVTKGNEVHLLQTGNFILIPPMVFHGSRSLSAYHALNFSFEATGALPPILSDGIFSLSPAEINKLTGIFQKLQQAYLREETDPELGAEATNMMATFLLRLARQHTPHSNHSNSPSSIAYQKIVKAMEEAVYENLSIQEIALRIGVSVSTIKGLFRSHAGIPPKKYYSDMRGIEALRLLEEGLELGQIAEKMNYSSVNYFSTSFKRQFGIPPGQYRKK